MNDGTVIKLKKGDVLCNVREDAEAMYIIIQGKITAHAQYGKFIIGPGSIIGTENSYYGINLFTYVAAEDTELKSFETGNVTDVSKIFDIYSDNIGNFVLSNETQVMEIIKLYLSLLIRCRKKDTSFRLDSRINKWEIDKHNGLVAVDHDTKLDFYGSNSKVATATIAENAKFINLLHDACLEMADFLDINMEYVPPVKEEPIVKPVIVAPETNDGYNNDLILDELKGTLRKIITYSDFYEEDADILLDSVEQLKSYSDRLSSDENARRLRKQITDLFYELYFQTFIRAVSEDYLPIYVNMFLNFGFLDEELAGNEASISLYKLAQNIEENANSDKVFTMFTWLKLILWGEKNPSRNTFDQSYEEYIKQQAKSGNLSVQENEALEDSEMKVRFEIDNLFKNSHYMTYGKVSTFIPVILKENILKPLPNSFLSAGLISIMLDDIKRIDFSLFYRSVVYSNEKIGISKDFIYVECMPEIILTPCIGTNGVLWEEINGRNRSTPARIVLPLFCATNPTQTLVNVLGKYRWEICRRIQGSYWNVVSEKSLTSEFYDYLLFYKKNKELSEQHKEKLKSTLINCRNNYAEVFAKDYESWILFESRGTSKLNKVSRNILAKYCPFSKQIRVSLKNNPIFTDAIERYERNTANNKKRFDNLYKVLEFKNIEIPEEIEITKNYYNM